MAAVIRKKAKAKRQREQKLNKNKQFPIRSRKHLIAPQNLPNREEHQQEFDQAAQIINKVIRPIAVQAGKKVKQPATEILQSSINQMYQKKIHDAKKSYEAIDEAIANTDALIEVLDARDPNACRYVRAEEEIKRVGKPLIIVVNKVDLIPKEIAVSWIAQLNLITPTVGISATSGSASIALSQVVANVAPGAKSIGVFGLPKVGKTTICAFSEMLKDLPSILFADCSVSLALIDASFNSLTNTNFAKELFAHCDCSITPNVYTILGIPQEAQNPDEMLMAYSQILDQKPKDAGQKVKYLLHSGEIKFYSMPSNSQDIQLTPEQINALELSIPLELSLNEYLPIKSFEPFDVDYDCLSKEIEEDEDEDAQ